MCLKIQISLSPYVSLYLYLFISMYMCTYRYKDFILQQYNFTIYNKFSLMDTYISNFLPIFFLLVLHTYTIAFNKWDHNTC